MSEPSSSPEDVTRPPGHPTPPHPKGVEGPARDVLGKGADSQDAFEPTLLAPRSGEGVGPQPILPPGAPAKPAPTRPAIDEGQAKPFGRYLLLRELGRGGMGVVYKARDPHLNRVVALKQVLAREDVDHDTVRRFMREAQLAAKLKHPNIVGVHDVGVHQGHHYFTTEFIEGRPLDVCLKKPVPVRAALAWTQAVAEALAYAHAQGIVHRDIKPQNILIDEQDVPHVTDFGLAKEYDFSSRAGKKRATLTLTGAVLGTPRYMSPEQARGRSELMGPATDQFSLGVVLYEMLTGRNPFDGGNLGDIFSAILSHEPTSPCALKGRLHRDVEVICLRMLEKDPRRRYPSMAEVAADIGRHLDGEPIVARPISRVAWMWRKAVKHRMVAAPLGAALLVGLLFLGVAAYGARKTVREVSADLDRAARAEMAGDAKPGLAGEADLLAARDAFHEVIGLDPANPTARSGVQRMDERLALLSQERERTLAEERRRGAEASARASQTEEGRKKAEESAATLDEARKKAEGNAALLAQGREAVEREKRALEEAIVLAGRAAQALDALARHLQSSGLAYKELERRCEEAQALIDRAIVAAPSLSFAHLLLGRTWDLRGWDDKAEACYRKAIELDPMAGEAHRRLAHLLIVRALLAAPWDLFCKSQQEACERRQEALLEEARKEVVASRGCPGGSDPVQEAYFEARAATSTADWAGAAKTLMDALSTAGGAEGDDVAWLLCEDVMYGFRRAAESEWDKLDYYWKYVDAGKQAPRSAVALFLGREGSSERDYGRILELAPRLVDARLARGMAKRAAKDLVGASQDIAAAVEMAPNDPTAHLDRGLLALDRHSLADAEEEFGRAIQLDPDFAEAYAQRGAVRAMRNTVAAAVTEFTASADFGEALRLDPDNWTAYHYRAEARSKGIDLDGTIADCTGAIRVRSSDADAYLWRAHARAAKGDDEGALGDYESAVTAAVETGRPEVQIEAHHAAEDLRKKLGRTPSEGK